MVQILPANPRYKKPSIGARLSESIGVALNEGLKAFQERQKLNAEEQQYQQENEAAKRAGIDLSGIRNPKMREKAFELSLQGKNQIQKDELKYKNKADEFAAKVAGEQETNKKLATFADKLEASNPNSPAHKALADIYRLDVPLDQKTEIIRALTGTDPFKSDQQNRLQMDSVLKRYNARLKELDNEIKNVPNPNSSGKEEVSQLRQQRMALRSERDQLLDFKSLNGMEDQEEDLEDSFEEEETEDEEGPKVKFDPNNKKHRAAAEKLFKKYKDKEKVRQILRKNFKGL